MQHKILFLNGPPGCGKDTIAKIIWQSFNARHEKLSAALKAGVHGLFAVDRKLVEVFEKEGSQAAKNSPQTVFFSDTYREVCIWLSEEVMKPRYGDEIFGNILCNRLYASSTGTNLTVISDSGFETECMPFLRAYKPENCVVWNIHRPGCTFDGDSRSYIFQEDVPRGLTVERFDNIHDLDMLRVQTHMRVRKILGIPQSTE